MEPVPEDLIQEIVPDVHTAKFYRRYDTQTLCRLTTSPGRSTGVSSIWYVMAATP